MEGQHGFLEHPLARLRPLNQVNIPESVEVGLTAIRLDERVIPTPAVHDGVEGLVQVRHGMHDPLEGLLADSSALGCVLEQPERLLKGRDHTALAAIALGMAAPPVLKPDPARDKFDRLYQSARDADTVELLAAVAPRPPSALFFSIRPGTWMRDVPPRAATPSSS